VRELIHFDLSASKGEIQLSWHSVSQYGNRAHCDAEVGISSPAAVKTIALTAPTHGGMARLNGPGKYRNGRPA